MTAARVCYLREDFLNEWRRDFPTAPSPVLRGIGDIKQDDVIDQSTALGHSLAVRDNLTGVDDKIKLLGKQIRGKLLLKQFLLSVLAVLDESTDLSDQLTQVRSQLAQVNKWAEPDETQACLPIPERYTCRESAPQGLNKFKSVSCTELHRSGGTKADLSGKNAGGSLKAKASDIPPTSPSKFISRINVTDTSGSPRSKSPTCISSSGKLYNGEQNKIDVSDNCISDDLVSDSKEGDMFRRKRSDVTKPNGAGVGHRSQGSKDNFLAVTSKHTAPSNVPHHAEGVTNSPNLTRNFQLLKLTKDFDFVLDSGSDDDNVNSNGGKHMTNSDSGHTSPTPDYEGMRRGRGGAKNSRDVDSHDVTSSLEPMGSYSTIQIRPPAFVREEKVTVHQTESSYTDHQTEKAESHDFQDRDFNSRLSNSDSRPNSSELTDSRNSDKSPQPFRRSGKGSVPPPVAKKPARPGSGKKLPPLPVGVSAGHRGNEWRPGNTSDIQITRVGHSLNSQDARKDGEKETVFSKESDTHQGITEAGSVSSRDAHNVTQTENKSSSGTKLDIGVSLDKTECGLSGTHVDPTTTTCEVERKTHQEVNICEDSGIFSESSATSQLVSDSLTSEVRNNVGITQQAISASSHGDTGMSSYNFPQGFNRQRKRNSIGDLVDSTNSSLVIISKISGINSDREENSESCSEIQPPVVPPRRKSEEPRETEVDTTSGEHNDMNADYQRMVSSASSDTIVNEFDRKESFSSDVDVKDAIYSLDDALKGESSGTLERSAAQEVDMRKRESRTPNYENWTINRALTTSLTQRDIYSVSDDDELDDTSPPSASPCLKRQGSSNGSKDSGLCDDISVSDSSHSEDRDASGGRARDQRYGQHTESGAGHNSGHEETDSDMPGVLTREHSQDEPDNEPDKRISVDRESLDAESVVSFGEDETNTTMDSSYDEIDSARDGMLNMREHLVKGVLDTEKIYLATLTTLITYKKSLEASSKSSQPVISEADIEAIFSDIEKIHNFQTEFVQSLEPKVNKWHHEEQIGEIFKIMIFKYIDLSNYLTNYQQAVATIHKCCSESETFRQIAAEVTFSVTSSRRQKMTLEDALFQPVQRVQRNLLVLHDLIKYTPQDHPDHEALQRALKLSQQVLEQFGNTVPATATTQENRRLVKSSFLVELVNGSRKLRYIFLFSDVLVCTKRETHRGNKVTFDVKWYFPLSHIHTDTRFAYNDDTKFSKKDEIQELKNKIRTYKKEIRIEIRKYDDKDKHRSHGGLGGATKGVEKLQKKINQLEGQLLLASPKLPFKVSMEGNKGATLLMSTEYEREEWKETIASLCKKCCNSDLQQQSMSSIFIQDLVNSVKETPQVNKIGSVLVDKDEDILTGILNVTIHKLNGLTEVCDTYCCLEMDSYGHFFMKARTRICPTSRDPAWNEDFELELEGSQTLRILIFKKESGSEGDKLLGRGALELSRHWLRGSFQEKTISMNEVSLVISVRHTSVEKTMQRTPSRNGAAVFGVKLESCTRRENKTVPTIVTACIQEVEKRGLDEVGIYRVSGVTSDLQRIKKLFDKNVRAGVAALQDVDIHAVTGVLKLYFRELPEPLFTEIHYQSFIDTLKLQDDESKAQCMLSLLHKLPNANYYTVAYLLEHLIQVARNVGENKMSIHNLSTVFGPTLLSPATKAAPKDPLELMYKGAEQVMRQSSVINYLLGLAVSGRNLRRSAQ